MPFLPFWRWLWTRSSSQLHEKVGGMSMAPEDVLARTPNVLSRDQQESYFANGYLLIEQAIDSPVLEKLRAATAQAINASRTVSISDGTWDLETGHTADEPKLRRLTSPND